MNYALCIVLKGNLSALKPSSGRERRTAGFARLFIILPVRAGMRKTGNTGRKIRTGRRRRHTPVFRQVQGQPFHMGTELVAQEAELLFFLFCQAGGFLLRVQVPDVFHFRNGLLSFI